MAAKLLCSPRQLLRFVPLTNLYFTARRVYDELIANHHNSVGPLMTMSSDISTSSDDGPLPVVGIGASAGGLASFEKFFHALPNDTGLAYVVVQHLSPDKKSELTTILQRYSSMGVEVVESDTEIQADHVYVLGPGQSLEIDGNTLRPGAVSTDSPHHHTSIDHFFESLAEDRQERAIGLVMSGTQSDGSRGVIAIKSRGGLTLAQSPEEAEYDSMPRHAVDTGRIDLVLPADELAKRLIDYVASERREVVADPDDDRVNQAYHNIISRLRSVTGHDFSQYKYSTMLRRIDRRIRLHKLPGLVAYCDYLEQDRDEIYALFDELLITVTAFFRDRKAFEALENRVIPELYDDKDDEEPIRIWVPACSSGEEVYSIAILMWEEAARRDIYPDFKIFATDLNKHAVDKARQGLYSEAACQNISDERRERFFTTEPGGQRVVSELRERVLFALHNILKDPPFARQDLVSCRNLLIYFDKQAQKKVLEVLYYALRSNGHLFLGASEFVGQARDLFSTVDKKHRIYRPKATDRKILPFSQMVDTADTTDPARSRRSSSIDIERPDSHAFRMEHTHHRILARDYAPPSLLVDRNYDIVHIAGNARNFLRIPTGDPTDAVLEMIPAELRLELRSALIEVFEHQHTTTTGDIQVSQQGDTISLRLIVAPVENPDADDTQLVQVIFETTDEQLRSPHQSEPVEIADADQSLQNIVHQLEDENERLRNQLGATIERYETTTEELKTSNEELMTINEELQSTTEELETSKEELQSTNEELTTVNEELSHKISEIDDVNSDLKNLLSSTDIGTIFLNRDMTIKRFTHPILEHFNILDSDVGRPFEHITHRFEYDAIDSDVRQVLEDHTPIERELSGEDKSWHIMRIHPYRTIDDRVAGAVLTFFNITDRKLAREEVAEREQLFRTVFNSANDALFLFGLPDGSPTTFQGVNDQACSRLGYSRDELKQRFLRDLIIPSSLDFDAYLDELRQNGQAVAEVRFQTGSGSRVDDEMSSRLLDLAGEPTVITVSRDVSSRKEYEEMLLSAKQESDRLAELRASFLANMSHEIRTPLTSIIGVSQLLSRKELPDRQEQMVQLIQTSGQRLKQTLDSVLDISRLESGEMTPDYKCYDIVSQISDDVQMLQPVAERKDIALEFHSSTDEHYFWADIGFINRIIYNLTENAIKFTEEGLVEVRLQIDDDPLTIIVSDTGIGIDEDFLPHLFDKFKQASSGTSRSYEGSGLGMSLVHQLVELMDGTIEVDSTRGQGTTFTVVVPEHPDEESQPEQTMS